MLVLDVPVADYEQHLLCEKCYEKGLKISMIDQYQTNPSLFWSSKPKEHKHQCPKCGHIEWAGRKFPYLFYRPNSIETGFVKKINKLTHKVEEQRSLKSKIRY